MIQKNSLSKLAYVVRAADLLESLRDGGPFTIFAPRNAAFFKIPPNTLNDLISDKTSLKKVLLRHVVPSKIKAGEIPDGPSELTTIGGEKITIARSGSSVIINSSSGDATVTNMDILAKNGIIHVVDSVF